MKKYLLLFASVLMLAACTTPKYAYYFDHYDYNSGKKKAESPKTLITQNMLSTPDLSPLHINEEAVVASAGSKITNVAKFPESLKDTKTLAKKYATMSKADKKEFRKELKTEVKKFLKAKKSDDSISAVSNAKIMDNDLKMALIFGIIAVVLSVLGGVNSIFWILGVISTVIAIVFLIKWIAEQ